MPTAIFNQHNYPPDGYYFSQAYSKTSGVRITAGSFSALVSKVRDFRMREGIPMGDPAKEVNDQLCKRNPECCYHTKKAHPLPKSHTKGIEVFAARVVQWLTRTQRTLGSSRSNALTKEEAEKRARVCMKCPRNIEWQSGCKGCDGSWKRVGLAIRGGKDVKGSAILGACEILAEDLRTSVFLPLRPVDIKDLPPGCWRKS